MNIQIDAGHGEVRSDTDSYDPGAVGPMGTRESEIALDIALKAGTLLKASGFKVFYTREKDREIDSWYKIDEVFEKNKIDLLISIHCNAFNGSAQGIEAYYNPNNSNSKKLAEILQEKLLIAFPNHLDRKAKGRTDLKVCNLSASRPLVLVEVEFIDHPVQEKFLRDSANRQEIARAIKDSICQYFGTTAVTHPAHPEGSSPGGDQGEVQREKIKATLKKYCKEYNLSYHDILSQALTESNLDPKAISSSRALGVGQIKLATAQYICQRHKLPIPEKEEDLFDIETNCKLMCLIMSDMLKKAEKHKYDTARLLYHDGEASIEKGVNSLAGIQYNNKVVAKKKEIEKYLS